MSKGHVLGFICDIICLSLFVNDSRCRHYTMRETVCNTNIEVLCLSLRPLICAVRLCLPADCNIHPQPLFSFQGILITVNLICLSMVLNNMLSVTYKTTKY